MPEIQFPQCPMVGADRMLSREWASWLQNPQVLSIILAAALDVAYGGTGLTSGTSGGILGFTGPTTIASSASLGGGQLVLGGGAGATPSTSLGLGLVNQTLHANPVGAPTWGLVNLTTDVTATLPAANGGTGIASYTTGDLLYASGATTLSKLADIAAGSVLRSRGIAVAPAYGKVDLTADISGTLPVANGGTGLASYTIGDLIYASAGTTLSKLADAAVGNVLRSGGVGVAPAYGKVDLTTDLTGTLPVANGGTGIASYAVGDLIYASGATTLSKLADVVTGRVLRSGGVGVAPAYGQVDLTADVTGTLPFGNGGTGLSSVGSAGQIIRSTGAAFALSTATYPDTVTVNQILHGTASNVVGGSANLTYAAASGLAVNQATLGNRVAALSSTTSNDDPTEETYQSKVTTTDATLTTLATIAIPASTTLLIEARVSARRTGGAAGTAEDAAGYVVCACYKNVAGTATEVGETAIFTAEDQAAWACTINASSGNALIQVTGAVNNNISWVVTYRTYAISS